jgi:hypothetical protein
MFVGIKWWYEVSGHFKAHRNLIGQHALSCKPFAALTALHRPAFPYTMVALPVVPCQHQIHCKPGRNMILIVFSRFEQLQPAEDLEAGWADAQDINWSHTRELVPLCASGLSFTTQPEGK